MNYFKDCKNIDDVKQLYRELAKKLHPDAGGTQDEMVELTRQYDEACKYSDVNTRWKESLNEKLNKTYGGYGGYRYSNQSTMWNEYKAQSNDPRLANYEMLKNENLRLNDMVDKFNDRYSELKIENDLLKKKLERLKKKLTKPKKKSSAAISL